MPCFKDEVGGLVVQHLTPFLFGMSTLLRTASVRRSAERYTVDTVASETFLRFPPHRPSPLPHGGQGPGCGLGLVNRVLLPGLWVCSLRHTDGRKVKRPFATAAAGAMCLLVALCGSAQRLDLLARRSY